MSGPLRDIDNLFYNGIEGHSEYPPDKVWDNIEADLDKKAVITYKRKYKAVKKSAVILLFLLAGVLLYEVVSMQYDKESISGTHQQSAAIEQRDIDAPVSVQSEESGEPVRSDDVFSGEKKVNNADRLHVPFNDAVAGIDRTGEVTNEQLHTNGDKVTGPAEERSIVISKLVAGHVITEDNNIDLVIETPSVIKKEESAGQFNTGNPVPAIVVSHDDITMPENTSRLSSFTITRVDDSWKKGIRSDLRLPVINIEQLPAMQTIVMRPDARVFNKSRFSLAAYFTPGISKNTLKDNEHHRPANNGGNNNGGSNGGGGNGGGNGGGGNGGTTVAPTGSGESRKEVKRTERNSLVYSGGVKLGYDLTKRLSVETGLGYLTASTIMNSKQIYARSDNNGGVSYRLNCSSGYAFLTPQGVSGLSVGDSIQVKDSRNTISYLTVPLAFEYKILSSGKFSLAASVGGQANILLKGRTEAVLYSARGESAVTGNTRGLKSSYFSLLTGITGEMLLNKRLSFTLSPVGQFGLSYINEGTWVKTRPNYLGLSAGLKLRL